MMKKVKQVDLHVFVEEKSKGFRAHCLEFDLAVSGANQEQTMVRMEKIVHAHIIYAVQNQSNPGHAPSPEIIQRWFDENTASPLKKSYILEIHFAPLQKKGGQKKSSFKRKYRENFNQLSCI